jgi:hypothetical protein
LAAVFAALTVAGCVDADLTRRDDGLYRAADAGRDTTASRILLQNPALTPKDVADRAASESTQARTRAEDDYHRRRREKAAREQFENDLADALKPE